MLLWFTGLIPAMTGIQIKDSRHIKIAFEKQRYYLCIKECAKYNNNNNNKAL